MKNKTLSPSFASTRKQRTPLRTLWKSGASLLAAAGVMVGAAQAQSVYSFGDSLSDISNVESLSFGLAPGSDYFNGRFSNGFIWVDYINAWLADNNQRINPLLVGPFSGTTRGFNFAHGGAVSGNNGLNVVRILGGNGLPLLEAVPAFRLNAQARHFRDRRVFFGLIDVFQAGADDFATISIGGNDYLNRETNVNFVVNNTIDSLNIIRQGGIRNFFVLAVPDLGNVPQEVNSPDAALLSQRSFLHNNLLDGRINTFERQTGTDVAFVRVDRLFDAIFQDTDFNNSAVFGYQIVRPGAGTTGHCLGDGLVLSACPDTYLSYDGLHPTRTAHRLVANLSIATFQANRLANNSSLARSLSISRQIAGDNRVISARLNAAKLGITGSGTFSNAISNGANGIASGNGLSFETAGEVNPGASRFSFYRYADGVAPEYSEVTPGTALSAENLAFSLDLSQGEYVSSYGADYLVSDNLLVGGLYTRATLSQDAFNVQRSDDLANFSIYGAWFKGGWTASLTAQGSESEQYYRRGSGLGYLSPLETKARSLATTARAEASYTKQVGKFRLTGKTRTSMTNVAHDAYREVSDFGLIDISVADQTERGLAAYVGASAERDFRLANFVNATVVAEVGGLATSSREIGFAPVLEDTGVIGDDVGNYGFRDVYRGTASQGGFMALGLDLQAKERLTFSAQASAVTTSQGTTPVARLGMTFRF